MVFLSLFPQGLFQAYQSFTHDYAYARSAEVIHSPVMQALVWARVPGDLVFTVGVVAFACSWFERYLVVNVEWLVRPFQSDWRPSQALLPSSRRASCKKTQSRYSIRTAPWQFPRCVPMVGRRRPSSVTQTMV